MKILFASFFAFVFCLFFQAAPIAYAAPVTITDDTGARITLPAPAKRIIGLYASFHEILADLGVEERIVARTNAERHERWAHLPSVGTHMRPNTERVLALAPDIVLQMSGRREAAEAVTALQRVGVPVAVFDVRNFADLFSLITRLGVLTGQEKEAAALTANMQARLDAVARFTAQKQAGGAPVPSVFFEVRYPNLLGAAKGSIVHDIIRHAGGKNCLNSELRLARPSEEELLRLNPDAYIIQHGAMNKTPVPLADRTHYRTLRAAQHGKIRIVEESLFSRPSAHNVDAVEQLAQFLYGAE